MFYRTLSFTSLIALAACGGSSSSGGSGPTVVPVSTSGFATAGAAVTGGDSFEVDRAFRALETGDGTFVLDRQDVGYTISQDGLEVAVTIAGVEYLTTFNGSQYVYNEGDDLVTIGLVDTSVQEAVSAEVFSNINDEVNSSIIVVGEDTNPTEIDALNGFAQMNGTIFVDARSENGQAFASGPIEINVDFGADTVSGDFSITDDGLSNATFAIPSSSFDLETTDIVGNGFSGNITQTGGDIGGSLSQATYDGRFFGQNAPTAGGQIGAVVTTDDDSTTVITGAFIATE